MLRDDLVNLRRDIHREPETGLDLPRTQERVLEALDGLPLEISTGKQLTSVTAVLRGSRPGPVVLLRADMDALPLGERTGLPFASRFDGVAHACGHDLHVAMLAGAAGLLAEQDLPGSVIFMFQPGEEGHGGARLMIEDGVLDAAGERPVAAYALHVGASLAPGRAVFSRGGPIMAASDAVTVTVRGAGGHASMPFRARDPIPVACEIVTALQAFVTRSFDVFDPIVLTVGSFHAGTANNVIPAEARLGATVRTFSAEARERAREGFTRVARGIAAAHEVDVEVDYQMLYPVTVNHPAEAAFLAETAGAGRFHEVAHPFPGSEDFSFVLDEVPGAFAMVGACPPGTDPRTAPANHAPEAVFDEDVLEEGAILFAALARGRLLAGGPGGLRPQAEPA
jgi:hippurate hydrolase